MNARVMERGVAGTWKAKARSHVLVVAVVMGSLPVDDAMASAESEDPGTLTVEVVGLESTRGQVRIAVFASEVTWLETAAYSVVLDLEKPKCRWSVGNVAAGDYGVVVLHDLNENGKNDRNLFGIPKEPYGFSNNVRAAFGPPKWSKARFTVASGETEIRIEVK
ncbi:MAG: DUF2141 domain-containing protein [Acidobacteriota bacterium]|nr:DUF2141 domain-containing protein [Acidobacteriota bacterium]